MSAISVGKITSLRQYPEFSVAEVFIPRKTDPLPGHRHERAQLHLVLDGSYVETCGGREHELGPGSALFRPSGAIHCNRFPNNEVHGLLVEIDADATVTLFPRLRTPAPRYFPASSFGDLCWLFEQESGFAEERENILKALALLIAARISRNIRERRNDSRPEWVSDAAATIRNRYAEDLRLSALAAQIGALLRGSHWSSADLLGSLLEST